jgi:hypothetical protein
MISLLSYIVLKLQINIDSGFIFLFKNGSLKFEGNGLTWHRINH